MTFRTPHLPPSITSSPPIDLPPAANVDPSELAKFQALAHRWWDPSSEFRPLHEINPLRLDWIDGLAGVKGKLAVDIGCGGGILAESLATRGALTLGIDLADKPLKVAELHALDSGSTVTYRRISAEALAAEAPASFEVVTCMELLEHVPDPASTVRACSDLCRPGGWVFFSTINRNAKAFLFAILGAEYVLNLLPRGTHDYEKFIRPSQLTGWVRAAGLDLVEMSGLTYNPITRVYRLSPRDVSVNYLLACRKPAAAN